MRAACSRAYSPRCWEPEVTQQPPLLSPAFTPLKSTFRDFKEDFEPETVPLCHISINKKNKKHKRDFEPEMVPLCHIFVNKKNKKHTRDLEGQGEVTF